MFARGCIPKKPACKSHMLITSKYYVLWATYPHSHPFRSCFWIDTSHHNGPPLTLTMTTILLQHPNQCWRLLLLSWEPHGFACVKRKERDNLPVEWAKNNSHELTTTIDNQQPTTTAAAASVRMFLIHLFPALASNYTPWITVMLSKLVSLSSDHGFRL